MGGRRDTVQPLPSAGHGLHAVLRLPDTGLRRIVAPRLRRDTRRRLVDGRMGSIARCPHPRPEHWQQYGHQRNSFPHRRTARHSACHLPGNTGRPDGGFSPQVFATHVCRQCCFPRLPEPYSPPSFGRGTRRAGLHRTAICRTATAHAEVDRSCRRKQRPYHPACQPAECLERTGTVAMQTEDAHYQESLFKHYLQDRWTNN